MSNLNAALLSPPVRTDILALMRQVRDRISRFNAVPGWSEALEAYLTSSSDLAELERRQRALEYGDAQVARMIRGR